MAAPILSTKLYLSPPRREVVLRPRLFERLSDGLSRRLTVVSAPAGFGKTTLLAEWLAGCDRPAAWLSLDEGDNDPARFLAYLVTALQTIAPDTGQGALGALQSPQPTPPESILTALVNDIAAIPVDFILVLDDYHLIDAGPVDQALGFLIEHLPPCMHLVIATREDPRLPLSRLRAHRQLTELRAADLRFTLPEAAAFLNQVMSLDLSTENVAELDSRTEGWIAGLQLAAISMQGHKDIAGFIRSFTGSHRFVLDYLVEEVLQQQPESVQTFLLNTSILDRMCGPLCDAVLLDETASGQETLEYLERANLFIVPLDSERRWYRYHHLFGDFLRQRLGKSAGGFIDELHSRASQWLEDNGLDIEAFQHAAAARDIGRAERLIEGKGLPLQFRGAAALVLSWLGSLPATVLDERPALWVMYASALSMSGRLAEVEPKLQAAEAALQDAEPDARTRNLVGHIAAIRALLAVFQNQVETVIAQSNRALEYLHPDNLAVRTATIWKLGIAYHIQGDRAAARRAYSEAISISQATGNLIVNLSATAGLAQIQEADNQLPQAAESYGRVLQSAGETQQWAACEAHLGLGHVFYEWNDLDAAEQHGQLGSRLVRLLQNMGVFINYAVFLARLKLAQGDVTGASALLAEAGQAARQHNLAHRMPEVAAVQVLALLREGNPAAAADVAQAHDLPLSRARVCLAQGDADAALAALGPLRQKAEASDWADGRLKVMVLQAVVLDAHGAGDESLRVLAGALALAEPGGFIRLFVDEGPPMKRLLHEAASRGVAPEYTRRLLAAFPDAGARPPADADALSDRELEVLRLIADGLSNQEIGERLFLALNTVKGHNRVIFDKLGVQRRTEAVARAREMGLL